MALCETRFGLARRVKGSVEEAKKQLIEAAEAAQPKTEAEAILSQGGIPSNTADLLKQRETSETADRAAHEGTQGTVRLPDAQSCPVLIAHGSCVPACFQGLWGCHVWSCSGRGGTLWCMPCGLLPVSVCGNHHASRV